jgi:hypothetical protein
MSELLRDPAHVLDEWLRRQQSGGVGRGAAAAVRSSSATKLLVYWRLSREA